MSQSENPSDDINQIPATMDSSMNHTGDVNLSNLSMTDRGALDVNPAEFITALQTTFQQMQDRFTTMMDTVMERMDEMADRLNELEKEVTDLVSYAGGIGDSSGNKDTENIPPGPQ